MRPLAIIWVLLTGGRNHKRLRFGLVDHSSRERKFVRRINWLDRRRLAQNKKARAKGAGLF
jgi:hypothetical protein